jgi:hypothetical protein
VRREAEILILRQKIIRSAASEEDARRARGSATERVVPGSPNVRGRACGSGLLIAADEVIE